ncbi:MAG TPA: mycothiol synthase [Pseudonocardia sp.]
MTAERTALTWRSGLDENTAGELRALLDAATATDHTAPVSENVLLALRRDLGSSAAHLLATDPSGRLVGYAYLDATNPAEAVGELAVHPDARRHGVGTALVTEMLTRAGEDGHRVRLWAHGEHPGAVRLAAKLDFHQVRTLWQLRRGLGEPIAEPEFPPGVRLRGFVVGQDEAEFLRVNNAAFDWHPEQGGWEIDQVKAREAEPWFDAPGFLLAVEDGPDGQDRLLGYHWTKVHPAEAGEPPIGEVYVLGVDPAAQGRKLGAALTLAGLRYLRERGLDDVLLYVEADNHAAVKVYQRLGFTRWHTDAAFLH